MQNEDVDAAIRSLADQIRDVQNELMCDDCRRRLSALAAHELTQAIGHGTPTRASDVVRVTLCVECAERSRAFRQTFLEFGIDVAPWEPPNDEG